MEEKKEEKERIMKKQGDRRSCRKKYKHAEEERKDRKKMRAKKRNIKQPRERGTYIEKGVVKWRMTKLAEHWPIERKVKLNR